MIFAFILVIEAICICLYLHKKTSDYFNPIEIMVIGSNICAALAILRLSDYQTDYSLLFFLVVFVYPIVLTTGCIFCIKKSSVIKRRQFQQFKFSSLFILLTRMVFAICVVCSLMEWQKQGFATLVTYEGVGDAKEIVQFIPGIHYGTTFLAYCAIIAVFELVYRSGKKKIDILYNLLVIAYVMVHSLFILISRGTLLVVFMALIYILSRKYKIRFLKLGVGLIIILGGFYLLAAQRITSVSLVFNIIPEHPFLSSIYSYTAINYENLNKLINEGPGYYILGRTWNGFWQLFGIDELFDLSESIKTVFLNATPLVYSFYDDLGIIGVVINGIIFGGVLTLIYNKSIKDPTYILLYSSLQKAIWMSFFGNYFTAFRVEVFPYMLIFIIALSLRSRKKIVLRKT